MVQHKTSCSKRQQTITRMSRCGRSYYKSSTVTLVSCTPNLHLKISILVLSWHLCHWHRTRSGSHKSSSTSSNWLLYAHLVHTPSESLLNYFENVFYQRKAVCLIRYAIKVILVIAIRNDQALRKLRAIALVSLKFDERGSLSSSPPVRDPAIDVPKDQFDKTFDHAFSAASTTAQLWN